jgi:hypothetical protein
MPVAAFDTLKYAKHLPEAGVSDAQAEAQVAALTEALQAGIQELATKRDTAELKRDFAELKRDFAELKRDFTELGLATKRDIAELRQEIKHDIAELKQETKHDIVTLRHEMHQLHATERSERIIIRWMLGILMTICLSGLGLVIRYLVFK